LASSALQLTILYNTVKEAQREPPEKVSGAWLCSPRPVFSCYDIVEWFVNKVTVSCSSYRSAFIASLVFTVVQWSTPPGNLEFSGSPRRAPLPALVALNWWGAYSVFLRAPPAPAAGIGCIKLVGGISCLMPVKADGCGEKFNLTHILSNAGGGGRAGRSKHQRLSAQADQRETATQCAPTKARYLFSHYFPGNNKILIK